tara:strand:+ start:671 stop:838 length:168 start_codon:yes stop_codon:yes gene_type:complete
MNKDITEIAIAQVAAISISISDAEQWLQMTSLILAVTFGMYKWYQEIRKIRKKKL